MGHHTSQFIVKHQAEKYIQSRTSLPETICEKFINLGDLREVQKSLVTYSTPKDLNFTPRGDLREVQKSLVTYSTPKDLNFTPRDDLREVQKSLVTYSTPKDLNFTPRRSARSSEIVSHIFYPQRLELHIQR
ncbi:hypothetical protein J6590_023387 [Homalodisca vitripennis]|nr:hypothetical protein J6590_023387 [Homalodisca vitripennis]